MRYVRHFLRLLRYAILAVLALAFGAILVLTLTERGRDNLAGLISDMASSPDQTVRLSGLDGIWSGQLTLDSLALGDKDGPWLVGRKVAIDWSPLALFSMTFQAERIFAERIELARLPKGGNAKADERIVLAAGVAVAEADRPARHRHRAGAGRRRRRCCRERLAQGRRPHRSRSRPTSTWRAATAAPARSTRRCISCPTRTGSTSTSTARSRRAASLANLLKLPDAPPVEIKVSGSGPLADWQGSGTLRRRRHGGNAPRRPPPADRQGQRHRGQGRRRVPEFPAREAAAAAVGQDSVRRRRHADGCRRRGGRAGDAGEQFACAAPRRGSIDPDGASDFALEVAATGDGVPLSFGTEDSPIDMIVQSASLRALGAGNEPDLDITAMLTKVSTNTAALDNLSVALHSDGFNISSRTGPVSGKATAGALVIDNPTIAPLVAGQLSASFSGTLTTDTLTVDGGLAEQRCAGRRVRRRRIAGRRLDQSRHQGRRGGERAAGDGAPGTGREGQADGELHSRHRRPCFGRSVLAVVGRVRGLGRGALVGETIEAEISGTLDDIAQLSRRRQGGGRFRRSPPRARWRRPMSR